MDWVSPVYHMTSAEPCQEGGRPGSITKLLSSSFPEFRSKTEFSDLRFPRNSPKSKVFLPAAKAPPMAPPLLTNERNRIVWRDLSGKATSSADKHRPDTANEIGIMKASNTNEHEAFQLLAIDLIKTN